MALSSYGSPYAVGHRAINELFDGTVLIQEKVDGSQISFGLDADGELQMRSKGAQLHVGAPAKMFAKGVEAMLAIKPLLRPGLVYRGEYLMKPKHNVLAYDRTPDKHIILFDIEDTNQGAGYFLSPDEVSAEAARLGLEVVPTYHFGPFSGLAALRELLDRVSVLGGAKIEGVVVKNYARFTPDKNVMMGKFVSETFKEVHQGEFRKDNPTQGDIESELIAAYRTPARWAKAVQHLREKGVLTDSPKDIGPLIVEVRTDVAKECEEEIKQRLYDYFIDKVNRGIVLGIPEWYKERLAEAALTKDAA